MTSPKLDHCIQECLSCHRVCLETLGYCLDEGGDHVAREHIVLLEDCADICRTSADFMSRRSNLHHLTCGVCAEVCDRCADDCDRLGGKQMKDCAESCRRCAESCREMAHAAA